MSFRLQVLLGEAITSAPRPLLVRLIYLSVIHPYRRRSGAFLVHDFGLSGTFICGMLSGLSGCSQTRFAQPPTLEALPKHKSMHSTSEMVHTPVPVFVDVLACSLKRNAVSLHSPSISSQCLRM